MDRSSAAPLFFGGIDAGLGGLLEEVTLLLATLLDDGLLAGVQEGTLGGGGGEIPHLAEEGGVPAAEDLVLGVDFQRDGLTRPGAPRRWQTGRDQ